MGLGCCPADASDGCAGVGTADPEKRWSSEGRIIAPRNKKDARSCIDFWLFFIFGSGTRVDSALEELRIFLP